MCTRTRLLDFDDLVPGQWPSVLEESGGDGNFLCQGDITDIDEAIDSNGYWLNEADYQVQGFLSDGESTPPFNELSQPLEDNWLDNYNGVEFRDTRSIEGWDESRFISWSHLNGELRGVWFTAIDDNLMVTVSARIPTTEDGKVTRNPQPECEWSPDTECPTVEEAQGLALTEYDDQIQAELEAFVLGVASDLQRELRIE
ncbi:hypothetical protein [Glycomyces arizonensis]|uniref:hypothetical protein n=1 Tax=Glycomyces arizonensis TaxID=256035 RepID=UPI0012EC63F7|nr:hypothetical protein [Glycomyces arizonensis]